MYVKLNSLAQDDTWLIVIPFPVLQGKLKKSYCLGQTDSHERIFFPVVAGVLR